MDLPGLISGSKSPIAWCLLGPLFLIDRGKSLVGLQDLLKLLFLTDDGKSFGGAGNTFVSLISANL